MFVQFRAALIALLFIGVSAVASQDLRNRFPALNDAPQAELTIMVFSDFECPFSKRGTELEERIISEYGTRVQILFRNYPLSTIHPNALQSAYAGVCAHKQGKFKPMHDLLFSNQKSLGPDLYQQFASELKLDIAAFTACMTDERTHDLVSADLADAQYGLRLAGTPSYLISGLKGVARVDGVYPFEEIKKEIDKLF